MSATGKEQPLSPTSTRNNLVPSRRLHTHQKTTVQHLRTKPEDLWLSSNFDAHRELPRWTSKDAGKLS